MRVLLARLRESVRYFLSYFHPEVLAREIVGPDGYSYASVSDASEGGARLTQVAVLTTVGEHFGGGGVFSALCDIDSVDVRWLDEHTLEISCPSSAVIHQQRDSTYFTGRTFRCVYRPRVGAVND